MRAIKDFIYSICESVGSKIHTWAWNKRWCNRETGTGYKK
jgi:hypothetical protein